MTASVSPPRATTPPPGARRRRRWTWLILAVAGVAAVVGGLMLGVSGGLFHPDEGRPLPKFASLADQPDPSLHGTVAYFADRTGCIRLVAAAGRPAQDVYCIPKGELAVRPAEGVKPAGPQLVWRPDGRLEVTMFVWRPAKGEPPTYTRGWQRVIDVRTGAVQRTPAALVPTTPNTGTQPTAGPDGRTVGYRFDGASGRAEVTLTDSTGTRTLLSLHGPGEYTYRFGPVFWAPNWQWIAATDDGRILVITPGSPSVTRVLVTGSGGGAGGGTAGPAFAITATDLLG